MSFGTGTGVVNLTSVSGTLAGRMDSGVGNANWNKAIYNGDAQAHHLIPAAALSADFRTALQQAATAAEFDFDINDRSNGAYLPDSLEAQAEGALQGQHAAQHRGPHAQYSTFVTQMTDKLGAEYTAAVNMGGDARVEAEKFFNKLDNMKAFLADGMVSDNPKKLLFVLNNSDALLASSLDAPNVSAEDFTESRTGKIATKLEFDSKPIIGLSGNNGFEIVISQVDGPDVNVTNHKIGGNWKFVDLAKAGGATGVVAAAVMVAGVAQAAEDAGIDTVDETIEFIENSNISGILDQIDFRTVLGDVAQDAAIAGLAALIGGPISLAYNAYELVQSWGALRGAVEFTSAIYGEGTTISNIDSALDQIEDKLVDWFGADFTSKTESELDLTTARGDELLTIIETETGTQPFPRSFEEFNEQAEQAIDELLLDYCFASGVEITMADGTRKVIEDIKVGDTVQSFDASGNLVAGVVDKLFRNATDSFLKLGFDNGMADMVVTPGHRFLSETGDFMEIGHMVQLGGGIARVVTTDGTIVEARGELIAYSDATASLFERSQSRAVMFDGATAIKGDTDAGWATYNFEVKEHHAYIAGDVRVHNDSILGELQLGDTIVAVNSDLTDMAVLRDVNGDGTQDFVVLDGSRFEDVNGGNTFINRALVYEWNAANPALNALFDFELGENRAPDANDEVFDQGLSNNWNDGTFGDDIEEVFFDDILGLTDAGTPARETIDSYYSYATVGSQPVPTLEALVLAAATGGADALIGALFAPLAASETEYGYDLGDGNLSYAPSGPSPVDLLLFVLGLDASAELIPGVPNPFGGGTIGGVTLGDFLNGLDLPTLGTFALNFGVGISSDDVTRTQDGDNLVLTVADADGLTTWTLEGVYADGAADEIVSINFADGTSLTLDEVTDGSVMPDGIVSGDDTAETIDGTYADADGDMVTENADVVDGNGGDDMINTLGGDDEIDGGSGNDTIDGGDGFDTVSVEGAWTDFSFQLDPNGGDLSITGQDAFITNLNGTDSLTNVEEVGFSDGSTATIAKGATNVVVTVTDFDGGLLAKSTLDTTDAKAWASTVSSYDANGDRVAQSTIYDDGRIYDTTYVNGIRSTMTAVDPDNAASWDTIERTYDSNGVIASQQAVYDDGRVYDTTYVDGVKATQIATDVDNSKAWDTLERTFDAEGVVTDQFVFYDDGRVSETVYDGGTRTETSIVDTNDAFAWTTIERSYNENGAITDQSAVYDDGRLYETEYVNGVRDYQIGTDVEDAFNWLTRETEYNANGDRVSLTTTLDDGSIVVTTYDDTLLG